MTLLAIILVVVGYGFLTFRKNGFKTTAFPHYNMRPLEERYRKELMGRFAYYQMLDEENKHRFEMRVQQFIDANQFIPRGFREVTDEMKTLISASAIQLTFGFPHLNFEHFARILIYPGDYYSRLTRRYHKGEVNPHGIIVLSWRNFVEGYLKPDDGRNLGLHEMAHALELENTIYNGEYDFIDGRELRHFDHLAEEEIEKIRRHGSLFFRKYAGSNKHEFFAVAVENFFEKPHEFRDYNPRLYATLAALLRQDPIRLFQDQIA